MSPKQHTLDFDAFLWGIVMRFLCRLFPTCFQRVQVVPVPRQVRGARKIGCTTTVFCIPHYGVAGQLAWGYRQLGVSRSLTERFVTPEQRVLTRSGQRQDTKVVV